MNRAATWYSGVLSSGCMGFPLVLTTLQSGDRDPGPHGLNRESLDHDVELDGIQGDPLGLPTTDGRPKRLHQVLLTVSIELHELLRDLNRQQPAHLDERGLVVHACTSPVRNWFIALAKASSACG